ncbi:MAG: D-alanyl-D-alanine carboxypeptidase family protein [Aminipila sp.]
MSIFNRSNNKGNFSKNLNRFKKRAIVAKTMHRGTVTRVMSICMVAVLVVGGGIMGISAMVPKSVEKGLDVISPMIPVDNMAGSSAIVSETQAKDAENGKVSQKSQDINDAGLIVDAKAAVLMDAGSGTVLFSQNGAAQLPPASVTKVMTMLLAMEAIDRGQVALTDMVTISERSASMGGSQMYMEPGEQHTLEELMKGISMVSANDACVAFNKYVNWENLKHCLNINV